MPLTVLLKFRSIVISVSVCAFVYLSIRTHNSKTTWPYFNKFFCMLPVAVAGSSSDGIVIRYVLLVIRMTSCFHTMEPIGGWMGTLCTSSPIATGGALAAVGGRPASSQAVLLPRWPRTRDVSRAMALQSSRGLSQCLCKQSAVMILSLIHISEPTRPY